MGDGLNPPDYNRKKTISVHTTMFVQCHSIVSGLCTKLQGVPSEKRVGFGKPTRHTCSNYDMSPTPDPSDSRFMDGSSGVGFQA